MARSRWLYCLLMLSASLGLRPLWGDDWPQWRGPTRTGHVPAGAPVPSRLTPDPPVVWRLKIGEGFASPVVAGGRVYYFDNQEGHETLHAIQASDSTELWKAAVDVVFK